MKQTKKPKSTCNSNEVATVPRDRSDEAVAALSGMDPLLQLVNAGADIETVKELVQLYRQERATQAQEAFDNAFARFQAECPPILHDSRASFATKSGGAVRYTYASLAQIARSISDALHSHGFSYSWDTVITANDLSVTCTIRHRGGGERKATFVCPIDPNALQSKAQAAKASQTFAQRCSLISALGLTTADSDTDGAQHGTERSDADSGVVAIDEEQARNIECLLTETGADRKAFLDYFGAENVRELPRANYVVAVKLLERKRGAR